MGIVASTFAESFPPEATFSVDDIPDLEGKIVIVTGSNAGIGKETVKILLSRNAKVYMATRNAEKARAAIADLRAQTGKDAIFLELDLGDLKSVKTAATNFLAKESKLDILFNNGGVTTKAMDELTVDGYDLQMGTNLIGHFYFTKLLLPILEATAQNSGEKHVRVLQASSVTHYYGSLDFDTFKDGPARRKLSVDGLYARSKYGNVVFAIELARRYGERGIVSMAVNPGNVDTDFTAQRLPPWRRWVLRCFLYPLHLGALTPLWGATSKEGADFNGKYLAPWARIASPRADSLDPVLGNKLWEWLDEEVKDI